VQNGNVEYQRRTKAKGREKSLEKFRQPEKRHWKTAGKLKIKRKEKT
jgi:hypothetical protein